MSATTLTLASAATRMVLCPTVGGAIVSLHHASRPVLRAGGAEAVASANVRQLACYPRVPFSNRIDSGRFQWRGQTHALARNFGDHPHPLHGNGWQQPWDVAVHGPSQAILTLRHDARTPGLWPFPFIAEQTFTVHDNSAEVRLRLTNLADHDVPAGLGWHPYFDRTSDVELGFFAKRVWLQGDTGLPTLAVPVPPQWDFASVRRLGTQPDPGLDNCFADWDGEAVIRYPSRRLAVRMRAPAPLRHLVVFTPPAQDFFAVEPVSHRNAALNASDPGAHGVLTLAPGASCEAVFQLFFEHLS